MSVQTILKIKHNRLLSKTWRAALTSREVERNNYHATGDMKKARQFATMAAAYKMPQFTNQESVSEPIVIYSR